MEASAGVGISFGGDAPPRDEARYRAEQAMARTFAAMQAVQGNTIVVSNKQKGNPVLRHIRNVRWQFANPSEDIVPDFILGNGTVALFISLRYHLLSPKYLSGRIDELQKRFRLRLVLCHVDVADVVKPLGEVNKLCCGNTCTLVCAWSLLECARYLESFKLFEHKTAESIQERTEADYLSRLTNVLTSIRGVNKTDVLTLGSQFRSLADIMAASADQLAACPGIGPTKVRRIHDSFHLPFRRGGLRQPRIDAFAAAGTPQGAGAAAAAGVEVGAGEDLEEEEEEEGGAGGTGAYEQPLYSVAAADLSDDDHQVLD